MSYVRGFIHEDGKFHIGLELPLSKITAFNSAMGTSISPNKSIFMILCDDGTKLIWKSNITDIRSSYATFKYKCRNHVFTLESLDSDDNFQKVKKDDDSVLSYDSSYKSSSGLTLSTTSNVRKSLIYGGVNYTVSYADGDKIVKMYFKKPTTQITPTPYNTNTNFSSVQGLFYNNSSDEVQLDITSLGLKLFFIPHIDHSFDATDLIQNSTDYTTSVNFFIDYINNVLPSNYKPLVDKTVANENTVVIFTQHLDQKIKYVYPYCTGTETCGPCMGVCVGDKVCSVHNNTLNPDVEDILTCDHAPYETVKFDIFLLVFFLLMFVILIFMIWYSVRKNKTEKNDF